MGRHKGRLQRLNYTVVIPAYNAEATLDRVVRAAAELDPQPEDILVVDDCSGDSTGEVAAAEGAKVIRHRERRGLAGARNSGLAAISTPLVLWFDSDFVPDQGVSGALLQGFTDEGVAGVGGRAIESVLNSPADLWRKTHASQDHGGRFKPSVWMIMGLCAMHRVEVLRGVGGFDERFKSCGEDVEMSLRLRRYGYKLVYQPKAAGDHLRHDTEEDLIGRMKEYLYFTAKALILHGHRPRRHFALVLLKQAVLHPLLDLLSGRFQLLPLDFKVNRARWDILFHLSNRTTSVSSGFLV